MKTIKRIICMLLACLLCLPFTGCGNEDKGQPSDTDNNIVDNATPVVDDLEASTTSSAIVPDVPDVEMCQDCGELPAASSSNYCVNCKCLLCNMSRKIGGDYMYCGSHNCNEPHCTLQRVEDSQYCVAHKCIEPNCSNRIWNNSIYCYAHDQ